MKVIIAPDSFKESLPARGVAAAIAAGFRQVFPEAELIELPIADGGEGTVDALVAATSGRLCKAMVTGPLQQQIEAVYGICGDEKTVVIEMAAASGLALVPQDQRNPLITTSFGTGELIRQALDDGFRRFIIGIGGSATNDGGAGMLQALGVKLLDAAGSEIGSGGAALEQLGRIDSGRLDPRLGDCHIEVACDVDNPLTGTKGASAIFGPQKGATPAMVEKLDKNLSNFAALIRRDLGVDIEQVAGAGAAGGMGAALMAFLKAELKPGIDIVIDQVGLKQHLPGSDLVITGEGRIDAQTLFGKVPTGVAATAAQFEIPVIALAGSLGDGANSLLEHGINALFSVVNGPCSLDQALEEAEANIYGCARNLAATVKISQIQKSRTG